MLFDLFMPAHVVSGTDAVAKNAALLKAFGRRCLLVTGGNSAHASGALEDTINALDAQGIGYAVFDGIGPNPLISACHKAGEAARDCGAEFLIGIGGGSPLDATKAVAIYAANADLTAEAIYKREYEHPPLPVVLIGTTAGTGSEVTSVAVLTDDASGRKKSILGPDCYARLVFADPAYTHSVPYDTTVSTALDALSHAAESWFMDRCVGITELFAAKGLPMLWEALGVLESSRTLPTSAVREQLYYGSLYAGLVINVCGTAFPHPLGYVLTEDFGVPHGKACAAFLPAYFERARRHTPERFAQFLALLNTDDQTLLDRVRALTALPPIGMTREQAQRFAERWSAGIPANFTKSPGGLTADEAAQLLAAL